MSGSDWLLCARSLDFPGFFYVTIAGYPGYVFLVELDAVSLPVLVWGGFAIAGETLTSLWQQGRAAAD